MKPKHTPEPWSADLTRHTPSLSIPIQAAGVQHSVAAAPLDFYSTAWDKPAATYRQNATAKANAERIVACVNACAGIPDPAAAIRAAERALRSVLAQCGGDDDAFPEVRAALKLFPG